MRQIRILAKGKTLVIHSHMGELSYEQPKLKA